MSNYQEIKRKGRILVEDSANLLGVIDTTGTLENNQVFIQLKRDNFCKARIGHRIPRSERIVKDIVMRSKYAIDDSVSSLNFSRQSGESSEEEDSKDAFQGECSSLTRFLDF